MRTLAVTQTLFFRVWFSGQLPRQLMFLETMT